jgi:hypothetical protein
VRRSFRARNDRRKELIAQFLADGLTLAEEEELFQLQEWLYTWIDPRYPLPKKVYNVMAERYRDLARG